MTTTKTQKKTSTTKSSTPSTSKKTFTVSEELPINPFTFEVLNLVSKQRTNAKKVEILKKYEDPSLKAIFIWNFDDSIISLLPDGPVPYASVGEQNSFSGTVSEKITDAVSKMGELNTTSLGANDQGKSSIRKEYQRFYNFIKIGRAHV